MRILEHPILGDLKAGKKVAIDYEGKKIEAYEGEPVAAALSASGVMVFRRTKKLGEPRGISCAIGQCTDCIMTVNGIPNTRTCVTRVEAGMRVEEQK